MNITTEHVAAAAPVTILRLDGDLDASSYEALIDAGRTAVAEGAQNILIDLRSVPFMGSSGLVAIHSIVLMLAGEQPPDPESGWSALHALGTAVDDEGGQTEVQLCAAQPAVERVLQRTGLDRLFISHPDRASAIAAI